MCIRDRNNTALFMMIGAQVIVTFITLFYFYKAYKTPPKFADDGKDDILKPDFTYASLK